LKFLLFLKAPITPKVYANKLVKIDVEQIGEMNAKSDFASILSL
tara:strand:- start:981 stop:1112 length:132 start_codon:yes stop_codon:yes gene_type:complete